MATQNSIRLFKIETGVNSSKWSFCNERMKLASGIYSRIVFDSKMVFDTFEQVYNFVYNTYTLTLSGHYEVHW